jgi:hypothetical protein
MSVAVDCVRLAQRKFKNGERYDRYQVCFADVLRKFRLVAVDGHPIMLER